MSDLTTINKIPLYKNMSIVDNEVKDNLKFMDRNKMSIIMLCGGSTGDLYPSLQLL